MALVTRGYPYSGRAELAVAFRQRSRDAAALRRARRWRGAMYIKGYAIECLLKVRLMVLHDETNLARLESSLSERLGRNVSLVTHSLEALFKLTGAEPRLHNIGGESLKVFLHCNRWTTSWRYDPKPGSEKECDSFFRSADMFIRYIQFST